MTGGGDQGQPPANGPLSQPAELHPMMTAALISNKPEFVKLFLENGVRLQDLVTWDTLLYLYEHLDPSCLFHCKLQKVLAKEPPSPALLMHHVTQLLWELLGDFTQPLYPRPRSSDQPQCLPGPHVRLNVRAGNMAPPSLSSCLVTAVSLACSKTMWLVFLLEKTHSWSSSAQLP